MWPHPTVEAGPHRERLPGRHRGPVLNPIPELHHGALPCLDRAPSEFLFATTRLELVAAAGFGPGAAALDDVAETLEMLT